MLVVQPDVLGVSSLCFPISVVVHISSDFRSCIGIKCQSDIISHLSWPFPSIFIPKVFLIHKPCRSYCLVKWRCFSLFLLHVPVLHEAGVSVLLRHGEILFIPLIILRVGYTHLALLMAGHVDLSVLMVGYIHPL